MKIEFYEDRYQFLKRSIEKRMELIYELISTWRAWDTCLNEELVSGGEVELRAPLWGKKYFIVVRSARPVIERADGEEIGVLDPMEQRS